MLRTPPIDNVCDVAKSTYFQTEVDKILPVRLCFSNSLIVNLICGFLQGNNKRTGLLVPLLRELKILLRGKLVQHSCSNLKEALKKAREHVPRSCSYRPLCRAKSYASLDERGISLPSVTEKEPPTNIDQIEPVDRMEEEGAPCTCVGNPLLKSTPCLSTGDIIAAPSEFEGLLSRNTKTKLATHSTPSLKSTKIKCFLICCLTIFISFCVGGIVYIISLKGEYKSKKIRLSTVTYFAPTVQSKENLPTCLYIGR